MFPLTKSIRATGLWKAFFLNSLVAAAVVVLGISIRRLFEDEKGSVYGFFNDLYATKKLSDTQILTIQFPATFIAAFVVYLIMYAIFYYGGNLLIHQNKPMPWY